ncbi:MAG: FAD-binding oxidoreductase [Planctomycetes bacterium]|nr:FAD-binding oxidoreductase [Planctomycetota bacterium]
MRVIIRAATTHAPEVARREAEHARKVERIAAQLRGRTGGGHVSVRKRAVAHQVPKPGDLRRKDEKVDLTDLDRIISIDPAARVCVAEPGVTYVDLVRATLKHGLVPMCVPEFKTITIGGAVSGCSIESMSFRFGGMHDTCLEYEVVTGRGEVLTCRPDGDDALVFHMMHGSFGTLGLLTKLTFRLVPAGRFVRMRYEKYSTLADYQAAIQRRFVAQDVDFMDGIIHAPDEYVLSLGEFVDEAPYVTRYDWLRVYYLSTRERTEDYLETFDYLFRYDRGVTNPRPRTLLGRLLFGKLLGSTAWLWAAERLHFLLPHLRPTFHLDVFLPSSRVPEFMAWYEREFGFFPLWCVPYRVARRYEWIADRVFDGVDDELYLDLAIYGMRPRDGRDYHRMMEVKLRELGGIKTLISHNHYTEDEFWQTWNRPNYERVKARTDPDDVFRDLYAKTCRAAMGLPG